jgi:hypothetical protein
MRKQNQKNGLKLNTETIRSLTRAELAAVNGGGTTTTYKLSEGCISQGCLSQACITH